MPDANAPIDPNVILASFESVLADAKSTQEALFVQKSKRLTKKERSAYFDSPAKVKTLEIIDNLYCARAQRV